MRWSEFATQQRILAAVAHDQLIGPGVVLAGTTRRDGSARISGVEPLIMDGQLWLSMMPASAKARDLGRDPRILVHSVVTSPSPEAEIMLRGTVPAETAADLQRRYATSVAAHLGWQPVPGQFTLFTVDISDVTYIGHDARSHAQHVARWPAGQEYLRPALTPTSLGPRQPVKRLLAPGRRPTGRKADLGLQGRPQPRGSARSPPCGGARSRSSEPLCRIRTGRLGAAIRSMPVPDLPGGPAGQTACRPAAANTARARSTCSAVGGDTPAHG